MLVNQGKLLYRAHDCSLLLRDYFVPVGQVRTISHPQQFEVLPSHLFIPFLISESLTVWPMPFRNNHYKPIYYKVHQRVVNKPWFLFNCHSVTCLRADLHSKYNHLLMLPIYLFRGSINLIGQNLCWYIAVPPAARICWNQWGFTDLHPLRIST